MKTHVLDSQEREIQGLFSSKDVVGSFWTLKALVELASYQKPEVKTENE